MTRRRALAAAGGATLALIVWRRRRRPRAPIPYAIPFAAVAVAVRAGATAIDLSPSTVFSNIAGFFGSVVMTLIGDLITPVANAIAWAGTQLIGYVSDLYQHVLGFIGTINTVFSTVADYIDSVYNFARDFAVQLFDSVVAQVDDLVSRVSSITQWVLDNVANLISDALELAFEVGGWAWNKIYTDFIYPIYATLDQIANSVIDTVTRVVNDLLSAAAAAGGWLWNLVTNIVNDAVNVALSGLSDLIGVVEGAWSFLVWVALHPLDWFTSLIDDALGNGQQWLVQHVTRAFESSEPLVDDFLNRVFG